MDKYVLIIALVNTGFTELVMDAARSVELAIKRWKNVLVLLLLLIKRWFSF